MKNLSHYKQIFEISTLNVSKEQGQQSVYRDLKPSDRKDLDDLCMQKFGKSYNDCSYDEQDAARSFLYSEIKEEINLGFDDEKESDDSEEENSKEGEDEKENSEEEELQNTFIELLDNVDFIKNIESYLKQYVLENLLKEKTNTFKIIPYVEFTFEEKSYGISVEFKTPCILNFDKEGKIKEVDLGEIKTITYSTPEIDNMNNLDDEKGITIISSMVYDILNDIDEIID